MGEGDIWILNDTYLGGTHLPDIAIMMPVFADGRVIAISAAMTHHQDVGGMAPGSTPTNATEIFQEGIRIPLLQFRRGNALNDTLIAMLRQNVRMPDVLMGDINAQVAACTIGARRLGELAGNFGRDELLALFDELLNRSETMTRQALRSLRPGTYRHVDYLDNDGIELDRLVRIEVAVTIADGRMTCDFTGTSPQVRGPFNCMASGPYAAACFAVRSVTDPEGRIPNNGGCFRPLAFHLPEGSLVNPREPAPTGCRTSTIKRITTCILGALRQAAPDRVPAEFGQRDRHHAFRRSTLRWPPLCHVAASGLRQRCVAASRRCRCDRDRCQQLPERSGRGADDGGADPGASRGAESRFRWARHASRRSRRHV